MSVHNMEEAAFIAAEYVSCTRPSFVAVGHRLLARPSFARLSTDPTCASAALDNLPNEVQFLLTEIRNKDTRTQGAMFQLLAIPVVGHWMLTNLATASHLHRAVLGDTLLLAHLELLLLRFTMLLCCPIIATGSQ
jgi:hypothetical protein